MVDISLFVAKSKNIVNEINKYLEAEPEFKAIPFEDQQNMVKLGTAYTQAQYQYEDLQKLITKSEYMQSIMKQLMGLVSPSIPNERDSYNKANAVLNTLYNTTQPLYTVRQRIEHLIWLYRSSYSIFR